MNKKENPWKTLKKNTVYENPWIKVEHHEVLNPSGQPGVYGTVAFQNIAVGVIPIDTTNHTYLVGQFRFPLNAYSWEIPEGGCQLNTDPLATAKRELKEETGIIAQRWEKLQTIHTSNSVTDEFGIIYTAEDLEFFEANPDEDEDLEIQRISLKEVLEMIKRGEITDSLSLAGILRLHIERPELFD
jgi:8-oxo-dGTP pyrophosphatase MutT (NUDIX family)